MPLIESGIWLFKHALAHYTSAKLADDIEAVHKRITDVYSDIAAAHFISARDAIIAAEHSMSPQLEIRHSIGHLCDAFNILDQVVDKIVSKRKLLFFRDEEYVIEDRKAAYHCLSHVAALIVIMYAFLQEPVNAQIWKDRASELFTKFLSFVYFEPEELLKINNKYVCKVETNEYNPVYADSSGVWTTGESLGISSSGNKYVEKRKVAMHKQFISRIEKTIAGKITIIAPRNS